MMTKKWILNDGVMAIFIFSGLSTAFAQEPKGSDKGLPKKTAACASDLGKTLPVDPKTAELSQLIQFEGSTPEEIAYAVKVKNAPRGGAVLTSSGDLAKQGIQHIIHAAPGAMMDGKPLARPAFEGVSNSVKNSLKLAETHQHARVAMPFIGGGIFANSIGKSPPEIAEAIVKSVLEHLEGSKLAQAVVLMAFDDNGVNLFSGILAKEPYASRLKTLLDAQKSFSVKKGNITKFSDHQATAIINAANTEIVFGGGVSGAIASASNKAPDIEDEARGILDRFVLSQKRPN